MLDFLNNLTNKDLSVIESLVNSPHLNLKNDTVLKKLFKYIKKMRGHLTDADLERKNIHRILFGRKKYNDNNIRKILSRFFKLIEKFIIQKEFSRNESGSVALELRAFRSAGLWDWYYETLNEAETNKKVNFYKDQDDYYDNIKICEELILSTPEPGIKLTEYKIRLSQNVNYFFIFTNLVAYFQILSEKVDNSVRAVMFDQSMFREVMKYTGKHIELFKKDHPNIFIIYLQIRMFLTHDKKYYDELMKYYNKNRNKFDQDLSRTFFMTMQHYLRIRLLARKGDFHENNILSFNINDIIIRKENYFRAYFKEGRAFDGILFLDILRNAFYLDKIDWLEKCYDEYSEYIVSEQSCDCYNLFSAVKCMHIKDFEKATYHLNQISKKFSPLFLEGKILFSIASFQLGYLEPLKVHTGNLSSFIRKNKNISRKAAAETKVFIYYFKKLLKICTATDLNINKELEKLRKEMETEVKIIPYRKELLQLVVSSSLSVIPACF